jgi:calcyclin binding protein
VKDGRVVLLLAKVNSYDYWADLVSKTKRKPVGATGGGGAGSDGGVMDMMKQMYDSGDDNMKRVIGQAWEKSQKDRMMGGAGGGGAAGMPSGMTGGFGDEDLAF